MIPPFQGPDAVLTMLKYLERKLTSRKIKCNRTISLLSLSRADEVVELKVEGENGDGEDGYRIRSGSFSALSRKFRPRSQSQVNIFFTHFINKMFKDL